MQINYGYRQFSANRRKKEDQATKPGSRNQKQYPEPDADTWLAWFDGSALPNPGKCCIACILQAPDGRTFEYIAGFGYGDSCDAEYSGLILTLHHANQHQVKRLQVHGDSQVVINDFNLVKISQLERMQEYRQQARRLSESFENLTVRWIPRHKNQLADTLTQVRCSTAVIPSMPATIMST